METSSEIHILHCFGIQHAMLHGFGIKTCNQHDRKYPVLSLNHCRRVKTINITYCECLSVVFSYPARKAHALYYILHRWADKFCLHCNIFIYIWRIWIKPVLSSRMVSFFHHTSPWTHRCLQSSPSAHRNGRVFRRSVQTSCCYWTVDCRKSFSNWNSLTNESRLWWSVCWCEYSKTLGKAFEEVKSAVRKWFQKQNTFF